MDDLIIRYMISKKMRVFTLIVSFYFILVSFGILLIEMMQSQYSTYFFIGVVGIVLALILILIVTVFQPKPLVILNNEKLILHLPLQRLRTVIYWNEVSHIGIGLSYITMKVENQDLKVDLEILRYHDLKVLKAKLMEVAESKIIPYNNI